jgi:hypothetical protein
VRSKVKGCTAALPGRREGEQGAQRRTGCALVPQPSWEAHEGTENHRLGVPGPQAGARLGTSPAGVCGHMCACVQHICARAWPGHDALLISREGGDVGSLVASITIVPGALG